MFNITLMLPNRIIICQFLTVCVLLLYSEKQYVFHKNIFFYVLFRAVIFVIGILLVSRCLKSIFGNRGSIKCHMMWFSVSEKIVELYNKFFFVFLTASITVETDAFVNVILINFNRRPTKMVFFQRCAHELQTSRGNASTKYS